MLSQKVSLNRVYFGVSFVEYNAYPLNRVTETEAIEANRALYFFNSDVLETATYDALDQFFHKPMDLGPRASREVFWKLQLDFLNSRYRSNPYPSQLNAALRNIAAYCHANAIAFVFVIPPQHEDARHRLRELGVQDQYWRFKHDLSSIAVTYDYDVDSGLTADANNFIDPFHLTVEAARQVVRDLWSGDLRWGRQFQ